MDKEQAAIERLHYISEISQRYYQKPVLLTYSGGKDSDACLLLAQRAGIPFEISHSHTTADAPQTVRYVREVFHGLELRGIPCKIHYPRYKGKPTSLWSLIPEKGILPTRIHRYCCQVLKENVGRDRAIVTGVRWAESTARQGRGELETLTKRKADRVVLSLSDKKQTELDGVILTNDNDTRRRWTEQCEKKGAVTCNPIIDWTDRDVWDYLEESQNHSNPLYQCGFSRVGCIGCPMAGKARYAEFHLFPAYETLWKRAFSRMLDRMRQMGKSPSWSCAEDVWRWWMEDENLNGQITLGGYQNDNT